jgi:hypothetical protein
MKKILDNERGVALLMVLGFIAILTALLADFTFETKVNSIKAYNSQDQVQARLNAESGLTFALAQLRIYQEARNLLEKNESAKALIKPAMLENVLTQPFIYPLALPKGSSKTQQTALKEFEDNTLIAGQFRVSLTAVKGFLNPNNLRISPPKDGETAPLNNPDQSSDSNATKTPQEYIEQQIEQLIINTIEEMKDDDDPFIRDNPNLNPKMLVKELKFYVNNPQLMQDPEKFEILSLYNQAQLVPKHAPLTSLEEMRYLLGWPDYLLDKMIDQFTVHEVGFISLNDLNERSLKLIFPNITPEQSEEFFRHRDGDEELGEEPKPFTSVDDFKNLVTTNKLAILSESEFLERQKEFAAANLRFGVAGKLYKAISVGQYNATKVTLTAYIDLPVKDPPKPEVKPPTTPGDAGGDDGKNPDNPDESEPASPEPGQPEKPPEELKLELLAPRIIEIQVD